MILRLRTSASQTDELARALRLMMLPARRASTCCGAQLYAEVGEPGMLCYAEEWLTSEDMAREIRSPRFCRLLELMETAAEPPELQFRFVSEVRGLDYVAEVREERHPGAA